MKRKKNKTPYNQKLITIWLVILLVFIGELFFYTWCRLRCVRVGYEISKALDQQESLVTLQKNLRIELARLKSPERIAKIASQKLGLTMPGPEQMVTIP